MKVFQIACGVLLLVIIKLAVSRVSNDMATAQSKVIGAPSNGIRSNENEFQRIQSFSNTARPLPNWSPPSLK